MMSVRGGLRMFCFIMCSAVLSSHALKEGAPTSGFLTLTAELIIYNDKRGVGERSLSW